MTPLTGIASLLAGLMGAIAPDFRRGRRRRRARTEASGTGAAGAEPPRDLARRLLRREWGWLSARERRVIEHVSRRMHISRDVHAELQEDRTFGERMADRVAALGGSWRFILAFGAFLAAWIVLNTVLLARRQEAFDPYPFILLNLLLSTVAALQAPIIMMSQNRQAAKDRANAEHDYEVNLKAEIEIRALHEKLDELREHRWEDLVRMQQEQIRLLEDLVRNPAGPGPPTDPT